MRSRRTARIKRYSSAIPHPPACSSNGCAPTGRRIPLGLVRAIAPWASALAATCGASGENRAVQAVPRLDGPRDHDPKRI